MGKNIDCNVIEYSNNVYVISWKSFINSVIFIFLCYSNFYSFFKGIFFVNIFVS